MFTKIKTGLLSTCLFAISTGFAMQQKQVQKQEQEQIPQPEEPKPKSQEQITPESTPISDAKDSAVEQNQSKKSDLLASALRKITEVATNLSESVKSDLKNVSESVKNNLNRTLNRTKDLIKSLFFRHQRYCPWGCGGLSKYCPTDQAEIKRGNIQPCAKCGIAHL